MDKRNLGGIKMLCSVCGKHTEYAIVISNRVYCQSCLANILISSGADNGNRKRIDLMEKEE